MIQDIQTDTVYISGLLTEQYPELRSSLAEALQVENIQLRELKNTMDIWCRDYMPVQVTNDRFALFNYDPGYLKPVKFAHLKTNQVLVLDSMPFKYVSSELRIDGGNIIKHVDKAIMTNKVFTENANLLESRVIQEICAILGLQEIIIIPELPGDFTGHADGMVRFIDHRTVLLNDFRDYDPGYFEKLKKSLTRHGLNITLLPWHAGENKNNTDDNGDYMNFLHVGKLIIVPQYGKPVDEVAMTAIQRSFPGHKVAGVDCRQIAKQGGALHCCTWNIKTNLN